MQKTSQTEDDCSFILINNLQAEEDADREGDDDQEQGAELDEALHATVIALLIVGSSYWLCFPFCLVVSLMLTCLLLIVQRKKMKI